MVYTSARIRNYILCSSISTSDITGYRKYWTKRYYHLRSQGSVSWKPTWFSSKRCDGLSLAQTEGEVCWVSTLYDKTKVRGPQVCDNSLGGLVDCRSLESGSAKTDRLLSTNIWLCQTAVDCGPTINWTSQTVPQTCGPISWLPSHEADAQQTFLPVCTRESLYKSYFLP